MAIDLELSTGNYSGINSDSYLQAKFKSNGMVTLVSMTARDPSKKAEIVTDIQTLRQMVLEISGYLSLTKEP